MSTLFLNPVSAQAVPRPIHFSHEYLGRTLNQDRSLLERIVAAYHCAVRAALPTSQNAVVSPLWTETGYQGRQAKLIADLESGDLPALHDQLRQMFLSDAVHALGMGRDEAAIIRSDPADLQCYGLQWYDRLVALAHAVGARPVPYPEDNPEGFAACSVVDAEAVVRAIEDRLGISLTFPDMGGVFGGTLRGRALPMHALVLLAAAFQLTLLAPCRQPTVLEIGGGFGGLAYWACRLLSGHYAIYDVPYVSAVQAYFLGRAFTPDRLLLFGEQPRPTADIALYPAWALLLPIPPTDLAVSQDSLPEVPPAVACGYLATLRTSLRGPLLSLNHESLARRGGGPALSPVPRLVEQVGGFELAQRSPFFLRAGFVQEVYYPQGQNPHRSSFRAPKAAE